MINAANIQGLGSDGDNYQELARAGGVQMVLKGRYYTDNNRLFIISDIIDAESGKVIHAINRVEGEKNRMTALLDKLTQEVLSYWAIKDQKRFAQNPPLYGAYQDYLKAGAVYIADPVQAEKYLHAAYKQDSNFYAPLIMLYTLYGKEGKDSLQQALLSFLDQRSHAFTRWEELQFGELKAIRNREWLKLARLAEERYRMDSSDRDALMRSINAYNNANRPSRALELIQGFDTTFLDSRMREISWRQTDQIFPNFSHRQLPPG